MPQIWLRPFMARNVVEDGLRVKVHKRPREISRQMLLACCGNEAVPAQTRIAGSHRIWKSQIAHRGVG